MEVSLKTQFPILSFNFVSSTDVETFCEPYMLPFELLVFFKKFPKKNHSLFLSFPSVQFLWNFSLQRFARALLFPSWAYSYDAKRAVKYIPSASFHCGWYHVLFYFLKPIFCFIHYRTHFIFWNWSCLCAIRTSQILAFCSFCSLFLIISPSIEWSFIPCCFQIWYIIYMRKPDPLS